MPTCQDVTNPTSYGNVLTEGFPEVTRLCVGSPCCSLELGKDAEWLHKLQQAQLESGTCTQGQRALYLERSAVLGERGGHLRGRRGRPEHTA